MISFLSNILPKTLLINLYKNLPFPKKIKKWIVWRGNKHFLVAVLGVILNSENKILLLKHTYRKKPWGIPSGWINYEDPKKGLIREIYEETSFKVKIDKLIHTEYVKAPHRINLFYLGKYVSGEFTPNAEISEFGFFDSDSLPDGTSKDLKVLVKKLIKMTAAPHFTHEERCPR